jgi:predicted GNAT family N-acyltransferase/ligand-binding SRPBCC domain-containing protein
MRLEILSATDQTTRDRACAVRHSVFVEEQGVPAALERDEHDASCPHVLALLDGQPVGAARYRQTSAGFKLERVAVLAPQRASGTGARIVEHVMAQLPPDAAAYVHAQESAVGFWARMGFAIEGDAFIEANIVHRRMVLRRAPGHFEITSVLAATQERVWQHASSVAGIKYELAPWLTMTVPSGIDAEALQVQFAQGSVALPWKLGRSWVLLLQVIPFDWDDMGIAELEPGRRFLERSSMLSLRTWQHERSVEAVAGGAAVTDRLSWECRPPIPEAIAGRVVRAIFRHRHARLAARFSRLGG